MKITWLGHSCFKVECKGGTVIFDPTEDGYVPGIKPIRESCDLLICSHEHGDHNARSLIEVSGLNADLNIDSINTFHDDKMGSLRGENTITIVDDGEVRFAHFGDLGCMPKEDELEKLKGLDLALIPVGGHYTVDGKLAAEIIKIIKPKVVIPMHYRDDNKGFGFDVISTVDDFKDAMEQGEITDKSELEIDPREFDCETKVLIMTPVS